MLQYIERLRLADLAIKGGENGRAAYLRLLLDNAQLNFFDILCRMPDKDREILNVVIDEISRANTLAAAPPIAPQG